MASSRRTFLDMQREPRLRHCLTPVFTPGQNHSAPLVVWTCRAHMIRRPQNGSSTLYWRQQRLFELWHLWNSKIQHINPNAS